MTIHGVSIHNQQMTVAARTIADKSTFGHSVISGRNTPPILEPPEHYLDVVAPLVASLVISNRGLALLLAGDAGTYQ